MTIDQAHDPAHQRTPGRPAAATRSSMARRRTTALVLGGLAAVALLGACGSDEGSADGTTSTADGGASGGSGDGATASGSDAFCDGFVDVEATLFAAFGGPPEAPKDREPFDGAVAALSEVAPEELAEPLATIADPDTDEVTAAGATAQVEAVAREECVDPVEVTAEDFTFGGLPDTLPAGRVGIDLVQESGSGELHELVLLRRNDDVDESFEEILAKGEAALADVTPTGFAFVPPVDGARDLIVADLEPGAYLAICFLPQNSSSSGDGPPHFVLGMQQEITVE